jgi:hypothetical protein
MSQKLDKVIILLLEIFLLIAHYFIPAHFLAIRLLIGIISYILIPGYLLVKVLNVDRTFEETLGLSLLFGFSIQILIITLFWGLLIKHVSLVYVSCCTIIFVLIMLLRYPGKVRLKFWKGSFSSPLFSILFIAVLVRLHYFSANVSSFGIDGGLYCDFARTIVSEGRFSSHVINDYLSYPYFNVKGFTNYPSTVFSIATFFWLGNISHASAKLTMFFTGVLIVFLIYQISSELFDNETALIAGFISAVFPLLSYYSSTYHGPEILSTLYILASVYFFILGIKGCNHKLRYMSLSGLFAAMTHGAWAMQAFIPLLATLTLIFLLFKIKDKKLCFYTLFLTNILFFIYKLSAILFIQLPLVIIPFICLSILRKMDRNLNYTGITIFIITAILSLQLFFVRSYLMPEIYIMPSIRAFMENPTKVANPLALTFGIHMDLNYILRSFNRFWQSMATLLTPLLFGSFIASFFNPIKLREKIAMFVFPFLSSILLIMALPDYIIWLGNTFPDRFLISSASFLIILSAVTINTLLTAYEKLNFILVSKNES